MREPSYTPGPWVIVPYGNGDSLVICTDDGGDWRICFMATPGGSPGAMEKIEADATLISAAPDMHAALIATDLAMAALKDAFGAPGENGYGTPEGLALFHAYTAWRDVRVALDKVGGVHDAI